MTGIAFGVWDVLHVGHVRFLARTRVNLSKLIVGVCGDEFCSATKRRPIFDENDRLQVVSSLKPVDEAFVYFGPNYVSMIRNANASALFVGEDFGDQGVPEHLDAINHCVRHGIRLVRLLRTRGISTSQVIERIRNQ